MKKQHLTALGVCLLSGVLTTGPVMARGNATPGDLDQYGCRMEGSSTMYHCYKGDMAGRSFRTQQEMLSAMGQNSGKQGTSRSGGSSSGGSSSGESSGSGGSGMDRGSPGGSSGGSGDGSMRMQQ